MGIPPTRFKAYPHEFSGGMRQRLMIALTLVLRPAFVVADEPTTALDVLVEAQIIRMLHDLRDTYETSLLLITHNLGIIAEACDRVAVMYAGRIVEIGDARTVFRSPQHPYTRELLRSTISLRTTGLNYIEGAPPDLSDPPPGCRFHPRCPDAMQVCAAARARARRAAQRLPHRVLGRRPGQRPGHPHRGRTDPAREGGDRPCRRSLSPAPTPAPHTATDAVVEAHDLEVTFALQGSALSRLLGRRGRSVKAIDGVNLALRRGEVLGLVGESGSGKTTLGRAFLGLVPSTGGSITYHGRDRGDVVVSELGGRDLRALRTSMQMVFQDPGAALNPGMTIEEAIGHPLVIHRKLKGAELRAKVCEALEKVGLSPVERS